MTLSDTQTAAAAAEAAAAALKTYLLEISKLSLHRAFHPLKRVWVLRIEQGSFTSFTLAWTSMHWDNLEKLQQHNVF